LPGQNHPGLGILREIIALLVLACDRLQLDGLVVVPSHYHVTVKSRKALRFLRPADEGLFRALQQALADLPLAAATEALAAVRVVSRSDGAAGQRAVPRATRG